MAAPKFTCTHCSGTGKQRIPYTRTASDRVCERCAGTGVLALEDAAAEEFFPVRPPVPRRLFLVAAANATAEAPPSGPAGARREDTRPTTSAERNEPAKPPSTSSKARARAANVPTPPQRQGIRQEKPPQNARPSGSRKSKRVK